MPVLDGVEATARLTAFDTTPRPQGRRAHHVDLDEHVYSALAAGASGFLLKDTPADQLVHAIRVVAAGDALLAPSVTRQLIAALAQPAPQVRSLRATSGLAELTPREQEVLTLLAEGLSNVSDEDETVGLRSTPLLSATPSSSE